MKLLDLEIINVRGVRAIDLHPVGKNVLLWGPNGSGKSAVVDAVDFLFTGQISRLRGKGTAGISLEKHGPHIDSTPANAVVKARIQVKGHSTPITLERSIAKPTQLRYDPKAKKALEPVLLVAARGQQTLTRREILKYITAEASTRAQEIQAILNLTDIEDIRKALVKVYNDSAKEAEGAQRNVQQARTLIQSLVGQQQYDAAHVLTVVNQHRTTLGAPTAETLSAATIKKGVAPPAASSPTINTTLVAKDIQALQDSFQPNARMEIASTEAALRTAFATINAQPDLVKAHNRHHLVQVGLSLLDDTGACPLCDTDWPAGELRHRLETRLGEAESIDRERNNVGALAAALDARLATVHPIFNRLMLAAKTVNLKSAAAHFQAWQQRIDKVRAELTHFAQHFPAAGAYPTSVFGIGVPEPVPDGFLAAVDQAVPKTSPTQTAWDELIRLEQALTTLEKVEAEALAADRALGRAMVLRDAFATARDRVLNKLYDDVRQRFEYFYRQLHGADEAAFAAKLQPDGAGLHLDVDFYGRGMHPPQALHSEGHQDSMGLCLYLALCERLTKGVVDLLVLDDVVMSVDAEHRRQLCHLLKTELPDRQFLITTHDRTWAKQLQIEAVVRPEEATEFFDWRVETGPQVNREADLWSRIEGDLKKGDVPPAAARLRRGMEEFFASVCDALQAPVKYKLSGRWELGDWLPAAMSQFGKLLKQAKKSAQSWGHEDESDALTVVESTASQVFKRTNAEQWGINASVHYNAWLELERKDFEPIVDAFKDLHDLFICRGCGGLVYLATLGAHATCLRCSCGKINWNLVTRNDTKHP